MGTCGDYFTEEQRRLFNDFVDHFKDEEEFEKKLDYLKCLASVYINVRFLSCSYDERLLKKVECMAQLVFANENEIQARRQKKLFLQNFEAKVKISRPFKPTGDKYVDDLFARFVIHQNRSNEGVKQTLNCSATFSRMRIFYVESNEDEKFRCDIFIKENTDEDDSQKAGCFLSSATASTKIEAKDSAAEIAMAILKNHCYTIQVKNFVDPNVNEVDIEKNDAASTSKNVDLKDGAGIGAKLMAKMGWSGRGGIGKSEQGRKEPVEILQRFARHGLGSLLVDRNFNKTVKSIIEEYAKSDEEQDLVFAANLSNEQRKFIHTMAARLNLRHVSYGTGSQRQLTIQKRKSAVEIVDSLLSLGGEDGKFKLICPDGF